MELFTQVQHYFRELGVKFLAHDPQNLVIIVELADESMCHIVVNVDEDGDLIRFTALDVIDLEQYSDLEQHASLSLWLLRLNSQLNIGAFHAVESGEVRFEYSMFATAETLQARHLHNCLKASMNCTATVRRDVQKLRLSYGTQSDAEPAVDVRSIVPAAIYEVYQAQLALLSGSDVEQLYTARAVLQGFLSANFSEAFNALLRSDLAKMQQMMEQFTPTEF